MCQSLGTSAFISIHSPNVQLLSQKLSKFKILSFIDQLLSEKIVVINMDSPPKPFSHALQALGVSILIKTE